MGTGKVVGLAGVRRSGKTFLFFDTIRSLLGFSVSKNTLFEYLGYLEDAFLLFLLPRQEQSLRKQAHNPRKLHVIDPGLESCRCRNPATGVQGDGIGSCALAAA